ncbi:MAG: MarR family winged helix-turn-helix transcriptional regulator [Bacteroidota bacterium]
MDRFNTGSRAERLMDAMMNLMMRMKEVDDTCVELNAHISNRELFLIAFVGDQQKAIMKEIADHLDVPMSTATGIVDKLVQKKIVKRAYSETDRRTVQILLDEEGDSVYNELNNMRLDMSNRILAELESYESDQFIRLIEKVTQGLRKHVDA